MNRFISQKFRFYSLVCIALLLFVHGYNLNQAYLQPFSQVRENMTFTTFFEYLFANGLLRFRIPLLFMISGYIFAMQDNRSYGDRIRKRFVSLMIPFFIWSAIGLLNTFLLQQFPVTAQAVLNSQLDQLGDNRPYTEIGWNGILYRWLVVPISFQLWFIRSLFLYNVLYPVFRWVVTKYPVIWFSVLFILWIGIFDLLIVEALGMFFFSLGIWLQKTHFPIDRKPAWFSSYISWLCFIGFAVIKTFMAFEFEEYSPLNVVLMILLHYGSIMAGILAVWFSADAVVKWCMQRKWFLWATAFSFIIYGLHVPLLPYITNLVYMYCHHLAYYRLITFIFVPFTVLLFCIGVGALLRATVPGFYKLATGGRGFN